MKLDWNNYAGIQEPANWNPANRSTQSVETEQHIVGFIRAIERHFPTASGWSVRVRQSNLTYEIGERLPDGTYQIKRLLGDGDAPAAATVYGTFGADAIADKRRWREAGGTHLMLTASWGDLQPGGMNSALNANAVTWLQQQIHDAQACGLSVCLEPALHYTPQWVRDTVPTFRNQNGQEWNPSDTDPNAPIYRPGAVVRDWFFTQVGRDAVKQFLERLFSALDLTNVGMIRIGGGYYGELHYPPGRDSQLKGFEPPVVAPRPADWKDGDPDTYTFPGTNVAYWSFGNAAQTGNGLAAGMTKCPVPGHVFDGTVMSADDVAFANWHLDSITRWMEWLIQQVRRGYPDRPIYVLHPSWYMRTNIKPGKPGRGYEAEMSQGVDVGRQMDTYMNYPGVFPWCTWMDGRDYLERSPNFDSDKAPWRKLYEEAQKRGLHVRIMGENTGGGGVSILDYLYKFPLAAGYSGFFWLNWQSLTGNGAGSGSGGAGQGETDLTLDQLSSRMRQPYKNGGLYTHNRAQVSLSASGPKHVFKDDGYGKPPLLAFTNQDKRVIYEASPYDGAGAGSIEPEKYFTYTVPADGDGLWRADAQVGFRTSPRGYYVASIRVNGQAVSFNRVTRNVDGGQLTVPVCAVFLAKEGDVIDLAARQTSGQEVFMVGSGAATWFSVTRIGNFDTSGYPTKGLVDYGLSTLDQVDENVLPAASAAAASTAGNAVLKTDVGTLVPPLQDGKIPSAYLPASTAQSLASNSSAAGEQWPIFVGQSTDIKPSGKGFVRIPLIAVTDNLAAFDPAESVYVIPADGTYFIGMKLRYDDSTPPGKSIGIGAGLAEVDDPAFFWNQTVSVDSPSHRNGIMNQRLTHLSKGDKIRMYTYYEGSEDVVVVAGELVIFRVQDQNVPVATATTTPAAASTGPVRWVSLGDSLTNCMDTSGHLTQTAQGVRPPNNGQYTPEKHGAGWPRYVEALSGGLLYLVNNAGYASDSLEGMLSRLQPDVFDFNPQLVTVMAGTNNILRQDTVDGVLRMATMAELQAKFDALISALRQRGVVVIVMSIPPWSESVAQPRVLQYNAMMARYCRERSIPFFDTFNALADAGGAGGYAPGMLSHNKLPDGRPDMIHMNMGFGQGSHARAVWAHFQAAGLYGAALPLPSVNNGADLLLDNALFLGVDQYGQPGGWNAYTYNGSSGTLTVEPRGDGYGNWLVLKQTGASGAWIAQREVPKDARGIGWGPGDTIELCGEFVSQGYENDTDADFYIELQRTYGDYSPIMAPVWSWQNNIRGTFCMQATVPNDCTGMVVSVVMNNGNGQSVVKLGRLAVRNLSR